MIALRRPNPTSLPGFPIQFVFSLTDILCFMIVSVDLSPQQPVPTVQPPFEIRPVHRKKNPKSPQKKTPERKINTEIQIHIIIVSDAKISRRSESTSSFNSHFGCIPPSVAA